MNGVRAGERLSRAAGIIARLAGAMVVVSVLPFAAGALITAGIPIAAALLGIFGGLGAAMWWAGAEVEQGQRRGALWLLVLTAMLTALATMDRQRYLVPAACGWLASLLAVLSWRHLRSDSKDAA